MPTIVETDRIGKKFVLGEYSIIRKNVSIGDDTEIREHCVIGSLPFTFSEKGLLSEQKRLTQTGKTIIGNNVYISCFSNVSLGSTMDTIIEDYVLMNAYVMVGHDVHIHKYAELMNGVIACGYSSIGENTFVGVGTVIRNRVKIGKNCKIGMGSVVVKDIPDGVIAFGNPCTVQGSNTLPTLALRKIVREAKKIGNTLKKDVV